ncbi:MAG: hypothetical protein JWO06_1220 [Bacteroidota bacterium]|nr:hypothetical protein [Bacteroidota bacterium]
MCVFLGDVKMNKRMFTKKFFAHVFFKKSFLIGEKKNLKKKLLKLRFLKNNFSKGAIVRYQLFYLCKSHLIDTLISLSPS